MSAPSSARRMVLEPLTSSDLLLFGSVLTEKREELGEKLVHRIHSAIVLYQETHAAVTTRRGAGKVSPTSIQDAAITRVTNWDSSVSREHGTKAAARKARAESSAITPRSAMRGVSLKSLRESSPNRGEDPVARVHNDSAMRPPVPNRSRMVRGTSPDRIEGFEARVNQESEMRPPARKRPRPALSNVEFVNERSRVPASTGGKHSGFLEALAEAKAWSAIHEPEGDWIPITDDEDSSSEEEEEEDSDVESDAEVQSEVRALQSGSKKRPRKADNVDADDQAEDEEADEDDADSSDGSCDEKTLSEQTMEKDLAYLCEQPMTNRVLLPPNSAEGADDESSADGSVEKKTGLFLPFESQLPTDQESEDDKPFDVSAMMSNSLWHEAAGSKGDGDGIDMSIFSP